MTGGAVALAHMPEEGNEETPAAAQQDVKRPRLHELGAASVAAYSEGGNARLLSNERQAFQRLEGVALMLQHVPDRTFASRWRSLVAFVEDMEQQDTCSAAAPAKPARPPPSMQLPESTKVTVAGNSASVEHAEGSVHPERWRLGSKVRRHAFSGAGYAGGRSERRLGFAMCLLWWSVCECYVMNVLFRYVFFIVFDNKSSWRISMFVVTVEREAHDLLVADSGVLFVFLTCAALL